MGFDCIGISGWISGGLDWWLGFDWWFAWVKWKVFLELPILSARTRDSPSCS